MARKGQAEQEPAEGLETIWQDDSECDYLSNLGLEAISFANRLAAYIIEKEGLYGNEACAEACRRAGEAVRLALDHVGIETGDLFENEEMFWATVKMKEQLC